MAEPMSADQLRARLARIEGQIRGISKMLEGGRACEDVVTQLMAVRSGIATVGALRPTTTDAEVWPIGSRGLVLIDTPPYEVDPDAVRHALDRTDLAVVVVTPDRYADAIVRDLTIELERRGVPTVVALNRVPDDPAVAAAITVDAIGALEGELTIVPESATDTVDGSMLRDRVANLGRSDIVPKRDLANHVQQKVSIVECQRRQKLGIRRHSTDRNYRKLQN